MHEAGIAAQAIDDAVAEAAAAGMGDRRPAGVDVVIDGARVSADAVAFHVSLALHDRGMDGPVVAIASSPVACPTCGSPGSPEAWLLCEACGRPLPPRDGPAVEAHFRY